MSHACTTSIAMPDGHNATIDQPISKDGLPVLEKIYQVPARQGRAVRLEKGQTLTVINTHGSQVCDFWAFAAVDPAEHLSMEHMRAFLSRVAPRAGDPLISNKRRPMFRILADTTSGDHDTLIAACDLTRYRQLGCETYHDNCADNLRMALAAIGLSSAEIPSPLNLWMNTPARADGTIDWLPPLSKAGDRIVLEAQMDAVAIMSACPQDKVPINGSDQTPRGLHFSVGAEPKQT